MNQLPNVDLNDPEAVRQAIVDFIPKIKPKLLVKLLYLVWHLSNK